MERSLKTGLALLLLLTCQSLSFTVKAQDNDFGMWYELGAEKKISRKWNVGTEAELRTRNDSKTLDRWSVGVNAEYKFFKGLKATAGYIFLNENNQEEIDFKKDGLRPNKWTPSYWGARHRFHLSLTGSVDWNRFSFSLRERWQYTYRPEATGKKYDFDEEDWVSVKGKGRNVLRSRCQVSYDIPHWKFDPFVNVELFNDKSGIQKSRYQVGVDYKIKKTHIFALTYRLQNVNEDDDDGDSNIHMIGLSYKYKF